MRRPLIEQYRRPYGLPRTVQGLLQSVGDLQLSDRSGDVIQRIYQSGGASSGGGGGGSTSPLTTKGDLWGYGAADDRVPAGANGLFLMMDSGDAQNVKYTHPTLYAWALK